MEQSDVELVKELIDAKLLPAIADSERRMMAAATVLVDDVRSEVRRDHAENRTRLNQNYELAATGVAQNGVILESQAATKEEVIQVRTLLQELLRGIGIREGEDRANAKIKKDRDEASEKRSKRWESAIKWALGLATGTGILNLGKEIWSYLHNNGAK